MEYLRTSRHWASAFCLPVGVCGLILMALPAQAQIQTFTVTLTNLTNPAANSGQTFSPAVFYTHDGSLNLWAAGEAASDPLRQIAEEGNNTPLLTDLGLAGSSVGSITVLPGVLFPGQSQTFSFTTDLALHPFLTDVWMLGRTNDGFSGQAGINLATLNAPVTFDLIGLDAGTEVNNELAAYLPALGGAFNDPENGVVGVHPGILGVGDAPLSWNWSNPVARINIAPAVAPEAGGMALWLAAAPVVVALRRRRKTAARAEAHV